MHRTRGIFILLAILIVLATVVREQPPGVRAQTAAWTTMAPMPLARTGAAGVSDRNGRIYVFGGTDNTQNFSDAEAYTTTTNSWSAVAPLPLGNSYMKSALAQNGKVYLIGGWDGQQSRDWVMAYDPAANSYACSFSAAGCTTSSLAPMPTARSNLAVTVGPDGWIYAFGGFTSQPVATVEAYDPVANIWHAATSLPHPSAGLSAATSPNGTMYVAGGFDGQNDLSTVYAVHRVTSAANAARFGGPRNEHVGQSLLDVLTYVAVAALILGGWKLIELLEWILPPELSSVIDFVAEMFDYITGGAFRSMSGRRASMDLNQASSGLLIGIGGSQGGAASNNVQAVNPSTGAWTAGLGLPAGRQDAVVAEGNDGTIYVIGGDDNATSVFNTVFALHSPAPRAATPTPTSTSAPTATAVPSATPTAIAVKFSVHIKVGHKIVAAGHQQIIAVSTQSGARVGITVTFPNHSSLKHATTVGRSGKLTWRYKEPKGAVRAGHRTVKILVVVHNAAGLSARASGHYTGR